MKIEPTFPANKLATTVGANDLADEIVVSQPRIMIPVEEEIEYDFDQQKFEEYLSSSSRSSSPHKSRRISAARKIRWSSDPEVEDLSPAAVKIIESSTPPASKMAGSADLNSSVQEMTADGVPTLSKRARQRRRQRLVRQFAKAMESVDGARYHTDLKFRRGQEPQQQMGGNSSKPSTSEWVRVRRNRSTLEERIRRRRTLLAHTQALVQEARNLKKEEVAKKPPKMRQVWRPKSEMSLKDQPPQAESTKARTPQGHLEQRRVAPIPVGVKNCLSDPEPDL